MCSRRAKYNIGRSQEDILLVSALYNALLRREVSTFSLSSTESKIRYGLIFIFYKYIRNPAYVIYL
jgi:hypothetical protein